MVFKAGNRAVRDHAKDGRALHLFESLGKKQRYMGEFVLANYSTRLGPDRNENTREVIIFHLIRASAVVEPARAASVSACGSNDAYTGPSEGLAGVFWEERRCRTNCGSDCLREKP